MGIIVRQKTASLSNLVRTLRQKKGWTLREMSKLVGIPSSTLAKVEHDRLSLNYEKLQKLASGLGLSLSELFSEAEGVPRPVEATVNARRSVTGENNCVHIATSNYDYRYLCADLSQCGMAPILIRIKARIWGELDQLSRRSGEEFVYVLEGQIDVHTECYSPITIETGQGIYLDSSMSHAFLARDCDEALVLAVCSGDNSGLFDQLLTLADGELRKPFPAYPLGR